MSKAEIFYKDIGDYLSRDEKLKTERSLTFLKFVKSFEPKD